MPRSTEQEFADERAILRSKLDFHRKLARHRVSCLGDEQAKARLVPSLTTPAGILSHLAAVERYWFVKVFDGQPWVPPWSADDPDADWRVGDVPVSQIVADYADAVATANRIIAAHDLEERAKDSSRFDAGVTLRWILVHMIEETAQHNGHLDILCEQLAAVHSPVDVGLDGGRPSSTPITTGR
ncbi:MAG: DinB family protein [Actinobacteria bacterium]|nr:DinB family protein [Actinomycetota bacterium]